MKNDFLPFPFFASDTRVQFSSRPRKNALPGAGCTPPSLPEVKRSATFSCLPVTYDNARCLRFVERRLTCASLFDVLRAARLTCRAFFYPRFPQRSRPPSGAPVCARPLCTPFPAAAWWSETKESLPLCIFFGVSDTPERHATLLLSFPPTGG